jgi:hypothetical protein
MLLGAVFAAPCGDEVFAPAPSVDGGGAGGGGGNIAAAGAVELLRNPGLRVECAAALAEVLPQVWQPSRAPA